MASASRAAASCLLLLLTIVLSALASRYSSATIIDHLPMSLPLARMQNTYALGMCWEAPMPKRISAVCKPHPLIVRVLLTMVLTPLVRWMH